MSGVPVVWVAYSDPGGKNAVEPVARRLEEKGYKVERFVSGWAAEQAVKAGTPLPSPDDAIGRIHAGDAPALMVSSMCTTGGEKIVEALMELGRPCVAVQDFPGGSMHPGEAWGETRPTILTVTGDPARVMAEQLWPDFPPGNIVVTGSPAVDALAQFDVGAARQQAREAWGIPDDSQAPVFLFAGGGDPTGVTLFTLVRALALNVGETYLVVRPHPRFKNLPYWHEAIKASGNWGITDTLADPNVSLAGADVVVGCLSTLLTTAGMLTRGCLNLFGMSEQAFYPEFRPGSYVPVCLGCCAEATTWEELVSLVNAAHTGKLASRLRPHQEANYRLDGLNAARVVEECKAFLLPAT